MAFDFWEHALHVLAYGFGVGLIPVLPGTFGSLLGVGVYALLSRAGAAIYAGVVGILAIAGVFICRQTTRDLGATDSGVIVWDEVVGLLVAVYLLPRDWRWIMAAFVLFRVFDFWKPFPVAEAEESFELGTAIMADDIAAALYVFAILHLARQGLVWHRRAE